MKLKCIIIDDEPIARKVLQEFIEEIDYLELAGQAENPLKAMSLLNNNDIDIIFLDINMPKINGIDFLKNSKINANIIMTTAYAEYAVEAYGLDVLDYLVKPIAFDRFLKACNKAKEASELKRSPSAQPQKTHDHFFIKCDNQIEKVFYQDLLYAEAMLNYVMLYTSSRKMMVYITIKSLEEQLPASIFIKVHKSFIVNINKIKSIEGNILDIGNEKIAISQSLREKVISEIVKDKMIKREANDVIGGGLRSANLTLPHFVHDVCSAIHPLAAASPFFKTLPLEQHGLEFIYPNIPAAHPFDDGSAAALYKSMEQTAQTLGVDKLSYLKLLEPLVKDWLQIGVDVLGPLHFPKHPVQMVRFGLKAITSATQLEKRFRSKEAGGLWAGMAAHSMQPLSNATSSAIGLVLMIVGHIAGWPIPKGGSNSIANALASYFVSLGGTIQTNFRVLSLNQLPSSHVILFDVSPKQLLQIAGHKFSSLYKWQLKRYRYGMGVFKIDWALDGPIPFTAPQCRQAGTVHLGNTFEEIARSEQLTSEGKHPDKPFVLLAQQSLFDPSRAPEGKHTAWAYCHVPNGSEVDMT